MDIWTLSCYFIISSITDINECELNMVSCGRNEFCLNTPGSARCDCRPGYIRQEGSTCIKTDGYAYVGLLVMVVVSNSEPGLDTASINTDANRQEMKNKLTRIFNSTKGFLYVEVTAITIVPGGTSSTSRFRRASTGDKCNVQYIIHVINQTDIQELQVEMNVIIYSSSVLGIKIGALATSVDDPAIKIYSDKDSMLCEIPDRTYCDNVSTNCRGVNASFVCDCKPGFRTVPLSDKYCRDINECHEETSMATWCVHGSCTNTHGFWHCSCVEGRVLMLVDNSTAPIYRCQGDYQYVGEMVFLWIHANISNTSISAFVQSQINDTMINSAVDVDGPISQKYVYTNITDIVQTKVMNGSHVYKVTVKFILRMGEIMPTIKLTTALKPTTGSIKYEEVTIDLQIMRVFNDTDNELCKIPGRAYCDTVSTECNVRNGAPHCDCKPGYQKISQLDKYCSDINECSDLGGHTCHGGGTCVNTAGNWTCVCPNGYEPHRFANSNITCIDIDECNRTSYVCDHGKCTNMDGGWRCECNIGYRSRMIAKNTYICDDIDECQLRPLPCDYCNSVTGPCQYCTNSQGSITCSCPAGLTLNMRDPSKQTCDGCAKLMYMGE